MARLMVQGKSILRDATASCVRMKGGQFHRHGSSEARKGEWKKEKEREELEDVVKLLNDHIQRVLVKKATPDWLPFLPGSSFWVPPPPTFANLKPHHQHQHLRAWPSSQHFFIQDNEDIHGPEGMEMTLQVKVLTFPENISLSEDDEG